MIQNIGQETRGMIGQMLKAGRSGFVGFFGGRTTSGKSITNKQIQSLPPLFAAQRLIAQTIGGLPVHIYKTGDRKKTKAKGHHLERILNRKPNPVQVRPQFGECVGMNLMSRWRAFIWVRRDNHGIVREMWPLTSDEMVVKVEGDSIQYHYRIGGEVTIIHSDDIIHLRGASTEVLGGDGPVQRHTDALSIAVAAQESAENYYRNGLAAHGYFSMETPIKGEKAREKFAKKLKELLGGVQNSGEAPLLEGDLKFTPLGVSAKQNQLIEARKYTTIEVAQMYSVPLHMLANLDKSSFSNIEKQSMEFYTNAIQPWITQIELCFEDKLLSEKEQETYFIKFAMDSKLRADTQSRYTGYSIAIMAGMMAPNEARDMEDLDPIDGLEKPFRPLNMEVVGEAKPDEDVDGDSTTKSEGGASAVRAEGDEIDIAELVKNRLRARKRNRPLIRDAAERIVARQAQDIRKHARKMISSRGQQRDISDFMGWFGGWLKEQDEVVQKGMRNAFEAYGVDIQSAIEDDHGFSDTGDYEGAVGKALERFAADFNGSTGGQIRDLIENADDDAKLSAIEERLDEWVYPKDEDGEHGKRADKVADRETVDTGEDLAMFLLAAAGVERFVWRNTGKSCPICKNLEGRTVETHGSFASPGENLDGEDEDGGEVKFEVKKHMKRPPVHRGCDCAVVPD